MSETTTSVPLKTAACSATWDLIEQLVQLESSKNRLHLEYMGKAMPADVYLRFQNLRDERIPALRSQLRFGLAAAPDQPPAHFAHAYADQLMLRCMVPVEPGPHAAPTAVAEALAQLEGACEKRAALTTTEVYNSLAELPGMSIALLELDVARGQARAALAATPALPATEDSSAGDLAEPTDAEIIALNDGERFFSMSESRFGKDVNPHTQYHTGEPGYLQFARAVLARWGVAAKAQAGVQAEPVMFINPKVIDRSTGKIATGTGALTHADSKHGGWTFPVYAAPQAQPADALDAARYRYLRDGWTYHYQHESREKLDASLDAAMAAAQEGGKA